MTPLRLSVLTVIAAVALIQVGNGVLGNLLPLTLDRAGYPVSAVGLVVTGHAFGFMIGSLVGGVLVRRLGHTRAFALLAGISGTATILFAVATDPWLWGGLRAFVGFGLAGLFVITESWLNQAADNFNRGRMMGVYQIIQKSAYALGQAFIATDGPPLMFFLVAAAAFMVATVPVATNKGAKPPRPRIARISMWSVIRRVPSAAAGCFGSGLINNPVAGMAPIYGTGIGLTVSESAILVATMQAGSLAAQWSIARLSDRCDRRWVILGCALASAVVSLAVVVVGNRVPALLYVLFAIWGAAALSTYGICVAQANDRAPRGAAMAISGSLQLLWSVGSVSGPFLATVAMTWFGPAGLFGYGATLALVLAGFVAWRLKVRPPSLPVPSHVQRDHL